MPKTSHNRASSLQLPSNVHCRPEIINLETLSASPVLDEEEQIGRDSDFANSRRQRREHRKGHRGGRTPTGKSKTHVKHAPSSGTTSKQTSRDHHGHARNGHSGKSSRNRKPLTKAKARSRRKMQIVVCWVFGLSILLLVVMLLAIFAMSGKGNGS
ncbi:hypothetical protein L207DRAFT_530131 [Hyaloscypha variabilis F]|uniref:Uncharacterized protein n=1 Tax=Hyaloscypha variabilis (strain UAMH 11265 / GT02V1 / F) TaxID=1149755 RepID=A0A2J6RJF4_HYAVF|nr:hypothetical protein L207DRAFT_530131 [Hyaloscypha variabilis F]